MNDVKVVLKPLEPGDKEQFILDNQEAFNYGALEEFGLRDEHYEEDGEIISRKTIEESLDKGESYRIIANEIVVGGLVLDINAEKGALELLFINPKYHSKGIGYAAWIEVEKKYPEIMLWETMTPYFEKRNIHFYVNRCGFHIVEFFNEFHKCNKEIDVHENEYDNARNSGMFRFEKRIGTVKKDA